ncbi:cardiolipin synthase [Oceanomicrobium pacificus]|uniref:Cardiolipin synthase n=1 Tax=Oceanomicrobium pacificus TaxID=2692916 RepID=A0A6B0TZV3_9RHOB|nr:cardiolipin synthase [Oceanomicrobium pacificus]MXU66533.1 cardiolipin synthase [Oceanomicrobium pacificus]
MEADLTVLFSAFAALVYLTGLGCAVAALLESRTTQGSIAWAISLVTLPWLAVPAYLAFGRRRFSGYLEDRKRSELKVIAHEGLTDTLRPPLDKISSTRLGSIRAVERLADMPVTRGNDVELLIDGSATFQSIFAALDEARDYVLVQFYIIRNDKLGRRLQKALLDLAARGVMVRLIYDSVGSGSTPHAYFETLDDGGVETAAFNSSSRRGSRFQINFRNHRKVVVVDGRVGFIGGHNVGDEYLGLDPHFGRWRDTHVRIEGPIVQGAQLSFQEDWFWLKDEMLPLDWTPKPSASGDKAALVLATGPADTFESANLLMLHAINSATERLWIVSPYYVPDLDIVSALQLAALRGVDVRVILPDKPDHRIVWLAAFAYLPEGVKSGITFYRYTDGFLHQKVVLIDHNAAFVGTANFDNRSLRLNFEITTLIGDADFNAKVEAMLLRDMEKSRIFDPDDYERRPVWFKLLVRLARLASPVL